MWYVCIASLVGEFAWQLVLATIQDFMENEYVCALWQAAVELTSRRCFIMCIASVYGCSAGSHSGCY